MYKQYNTNQLSLELNLAWDLPATHEAHLISQFVDTIPQSVLLEETSHTVIFYNIISLFEVQSKREWL